jgi:hypothetical protein
VRRALLHVVHRPLGVLPLTQQALSRWLPEACGRYPRPPTVGLAPLRPSATTGCSYSPCGEVDDCDQEYSSFRLGDGTSAGSPLRRVRSFSGRRTCQPRANGELSACRQRRSSLKSPRFQRFQRADDRVRTGDPQLGKLMLYQLSYVRAQVILPGDAENLPYGHTSRTKRRAARPDWR